VTQPPPPTVDGRAAETAPAGHPETTEERWLREVFTYHPPTPEDREAYTAIREKAKDLVRAIKANTPRCADQTAAIRKVREAVMTANAARALRGLV